MTHAGQLLVTPPRHFKTLVFHVEMPRRSEKPLSGVLHARRAEVMSDEAEGRVGHYLSKTE